MGFKEQLKQELSYNGMLVKELAAVSGVHKRALDTYLCEKASMPPADTAVKIAHSLGVTVEYLVTGEDSSFPKDIRMIAHNLFSLGKRDRRLIAALVKEMMERREDRK